MKMHLGMITMICWLIIVFLILQNRFVVPELLIKVGGPSILLGGVGLAVGTAFPRYYRLQYRSILLGIAGFIALTAGISALTKQ